MEEISYSEGRIIYWHYKKRVGSVEITKLASEDECRVPQGKDTIMAHVNLFAPPLVDIVYRAERDRSMEGKRLKFFIGLHTYQNNTRPAAFYTRLSNDTAEIEHPYILTGYVTYFNIGQYGYGFITPYRFGTKVAMLLRYYKVPGNIFFSSKQISEPLMAAIHEQLPKVDQVLKLPRPLLVTSYIGQTVFRSKNEETLCANRVELLNP